MKIEMKVDINADISKVWDALKNPSKVRELQQ